MKIKKLALFSIFLLMGTLFLNGCTANRRPVNPESGQTRTVPGPTRVTPPITPTPGTRDSTPSPTRVRPNNAPTRPVPRTTGPNLGSDMAPGTMRRPSTTGNMGSKAKAVAEDIAREKDIKSASCVITGDTALVGLQFDKQYKGDVTDDIKRTVEERVKKKESSIKNVVVTADPDILSRIKTMASDIEGGKPLSGFTNEIEEIIRRVNPF